MNVRGRLSATGKLLLLAGLVFIAMGGTAFAAPERGGDRVIGGRPVPNGKYPFLAYIDIPNSGCTGTLVAFRWALTAAHCVYGRRGLLEAESLGVVVNRTDLAETGKGRRIGVVEIVPHPDYDPRSSANDVALLRLSEPVEARNLIALAPKNSTKFDRPNRKALIAGWGAVAQQPNVYPDRAEWAGVRVLSNQECNRLWDGGILPSMVCAGQLPKTTCSGDSGGPLFVRAQGRYVQIGVTSFGSYTCGELPSVFGRVSSPPIANFIEATIASG